MRIAFVLYQFPVISEAFLLERMVRLMDRGHELTIYASGPSIETVEQPDVARYELRRRVIHYGQMRPGSVPRKRRYDMVQCCFGPGGRSGLALRDMGVLDGPLATSFHGYDVTRVPQREGPGCYADLFARGDLFLPSSEYLRARLLALGCPPERTNVVLTGLDLRAFTPPARKSRGARVLSVGRLVAKKGLADGLSAVAAALTEVPSIEYRIVGDGPLRASLGEHARALGMKARVRFLGSLDHDGVRAQMARADVLLTPSRTDPDGDAEGIPNVAKEALAMGVPVVSTRHAGIPELVVDGVNGFLADEGDAAALARGVVRLLTDPAAYEAARHAARPSCERFDSRAITEQLESLYQGLSGRWRKSTPAALGRGRGGRGARKATRVE